MTTVTHDGLEIPDGEAKTYAIYADPENSVVASSYRTLCGALAEAPPTWKAEIVHNGLTMAVSMSLDAHAWVLTNAGKHELGHEARMIEERWRK